MNMDISQPAEGAIQDTPAHQSLFPPDSPDIRPSSKLHVLFWSLYALILVSVNILLIAYLLMHQNPVGAIAMFYGAPVFNLAIALTAVCFLPARKRLGSPLTAWGFAGCAILPPMAMTIFDGFWLFNMSINFC